MSDRILSVLLLLGWQAAMLTSPAALQPLVCAVAGIVVGLAIVALLASGAPQRPFAGEGEPGLEQLALAFPLH
jgi:hypothetical protein